jgi:hypothetical protein
MDFGSNFRKEMRKMQQDMEKGLGMALAPVDDFGRNMRKEMKKMQAEMQKGFGMAPFKELAPLKAKLKVRHYMSSHSWPIGQAGNG